MFVLKYVQKNVYAFYDMKIMEYIVSLKLDISIMRVSNIFDTSKCVSFMWSYPYQLRNKSKNLANDVPVKDVKLSFNDRLLNFELDNKCLLLI